MAVLREKYVAYREREDFVGMDLAHKFLQMGDADHAVRLILGGRKYEKDDTERTPQQWADPEKRSVAVVFRDAWQVTDDPVYQRLKERHQEEVHDPAVSPMAE